MVQIQILSHEWQQKYGVLQGDISRSGGFRGGGAQ